MKNVFLAAAVALIAGTGCKKYDMPSNVPTPHPYVQELTMGADVSWITQMEDAGKKFYDTTGTEKEGIQLMKELGVKAIRLRVWVNPANRYNGLADVLAKAERVKAAGMKLMIDFHYSDSWADPAQQVKPATWAAADFNGLKDSVYNHTLHVLGALKARNIVPEWVQVGNETNDGMLWPDGKASINMANFAALINAGYNAVKANDTTSKVIVHMANGYNNTIFRWLYDGLTTNNAKYDIIGMSLYVEETTWPTLNQQCEANMKDVIVRYNKDVMLCEIGMPATSGAACKRFIEDITEKVYHLPNRRGLGLFYWEPQAYDSWEGYKLGAFTDQGRPTSALEAFK
ncbi:arabinogalactan endo-1,4-beta-galactosidase [Filimonas zeae]|uniref:Arabinogalactan endo-beta-1,4-galactanase n=1 Tax=Filimonas zeae TaxID=1737353 RepID=A0A917J4H9_9BACT|nr:glycosyl hydrolase 53 family protein [Filimonas zeae]MDR6341255.1 arabinogalactan endo-1,4-beta-galactosidase [Filimonas zeae]GGH76607.1 arabinogalactan endo-beta-1,4-galactanase [Filimonas zeae]